jgi:hypothetical protein
MAQIIHYTFNANDFSELDVAPTGTKVTTSVSAGLNGTAAGVERTIGGSGDTSGSDTVSGLNDSAATEIRIGFRFNLNTLNLSSGAIVLFQITSDTSGYLIWFLVRESGGDIIEFYGEDDGLTGAGVTQSSPLSSGEITVEGVVNQAATGVSSDGSVTLFVNGSQVDQVTGLDNFDAFEEFLDGLSVFYLTVDNATGSGIAYYDEIIIRDDSTPIYPPSTEFHFLGFDADTTTLMVSGLKDAGTLKLYDYDLAALGENGTAEFGSATETDLTNRTKGIFPVSKPMQDDVWYVYGRDGSDVQTYYNNRNGTLGWVDIGPGTATWGATKYAIALMPSPTRPDDVIVAFSDDDIYRTRFGTQTWVKMGDAGGGLRAAGRHINNRFNELLAGGTAAGTLEYSNNFGASFGDVSGTALGVINAIEVSL